MTASVRGGLDEAMSEAVPQVNRQVTLAQRPVGLPRESDFALVNGPVPEPGPGQVLLRTLYVSVDPYMRGRLRDAKSYTAPQAVGAVMEGGTVARVAGSRQPDFAAGEIVVARTGWQDYGLSDGSGLRRVDPRQAPISTALGVLGMPGLTAYCGLLRVGQPRAGETVLVSAAAGAVGSAVGQIAKIHGCRAVGVAGTDAKVRHVVEDLGFDAAFNHRTTADYDAALAQHCPDGIDVHFDNVGGPLSDATFRHLNVHARVAVCGQISHYNDVQPATGPRVLWTLITKRARVEGFLVSDFQADHAAALAELAGWIAAGRLRYREDVVAGLEHTPRAFIGLLQGENIGKRVVKVAD